METNSGILKRKLSLIAVTEYSFFPFFWRNILKKITKRANYSFIAITLIISSGNLFAQGRKLQISCDFPGGNVIVEKMGNDTVWLRPDIRDTRGYWFYWYFKISGISGRVIHFQFPEKPVFARYGPAYSINNDNTWKWYGETSYRDHGFTFNFSKEDTCAYFSIAFPYTQKNLYEFLGKLWGRDLIKLDTLCFSREGRAVEELHIMPTKGTIYKVFITARHHACEMTADYVLEGIIRSIINERNLQFLRNHVEFLIIPFVDKDGVEEGDQGKNRKPRDHNRDYDKNAIYPEVKAIMAKVPEWSDHKLKIMMDIHCPYLRGNGDAEYIHLVGTKNEANAHQQILMSKLIKKENMGELRFYSKNFMKYGTGWNTDKNNTQGPSYKVWGTTIPEVSLSTTIEFPYANVSGIAVSKDNARVFGRTIAYAMQDYLRSLDRSESK